MGIKTRERVLFYPSKRNTAVETIVRISVNWASLYQLTYRLGCKQTYKLASKQ
jgi:hypothetical protein